MKIYSESELAFPPKMIITAFLQFFLIFLILKINNIYLIDQMDNWSLSLRIMDPLCIKLHAGHRC